MIRHSEYTDFELTSRLSEGDELAYTEIFERYSRVMYIYARNLSRDQEEAEDLVQDVFTSLWSRSGELELKGPLSSYLYTAVRYRFMNLVAKKKIRADYVESFQAFIDEAEYSTDDYINEKELIRLIEKEVGKLPEKMREVFELSRNIGLSHREIAEQLNITEKTVKNHINHALRVLRGKFGIVPVMIYLLNS